MTDIVRWYHSPCNPLWYTNHFTSFLILYGDTTILVAPIDTQTIPVCLVFCNITLYDDTTFMLDTLLNKMIAVWTIVILSSCHKLLPYELLYAFVRRLPTAADATTETATGQRQNVYSARILNTMTNLSKQTRDTILTKTQITQYKTLSNFCNYNRKLLPENSVGRQSVARSHFCDLLRAQLNTVGVRGVQSNTQRSENDVIFMGKSGNMWLK